MAKCVKPNSDFYYPLENKNLMRNQPIVLNNDEETTKLINSKLVEECESLIPAGNLNITTIGEHFVAPYKTVTINVKAVCLILHGGENLEQIHYMPYVKGEMTELPTEQLYNDKFEAVEGYHFAGWTTTANDAGTIINDNFAIQDDLDIYALLEENGNNGEEEIHT